MSTLSLPARPSMRLRVTLTLLALMISAPLMCLASMTAPGVVTTRSPLTTDSAVPAGTPVFVGPGLPPGRVTVGAVVTAGAGFTGAGVERTGGAAARVAADVAAETGSCARSARASVERAADAE